MYSIEFLSLSLENLILLDKKPFPNPLTLNESLVLLNFNNFSSLIYEPGPGDCDYDSNLLEL